MADSSSPVGRHVRPVHPPFTHFPVAAYVMAAVFDLISAAGGGRHRWAAQLWHAGTFVLMAGLAICLLTMLTGFADLVRFGEQRPRVVRGIAVHVCVMAAVFVIGVGDLSWRLADGNQASTPPGVLVMTVAAAIGVCAGGYLGGTLVYRHGSGVGVTVAPPESASRSASAAGPRGHGTPMRPIRLPGQRSARAAASRRIDPGD